MTKKKVKPTFTDRLQKYFNRLNFLGLVTAAIFYCFSLLPSLLPRPWLMQGIISGVSLAIGYGIGTAGSALARWMLQKEPSKATKQQAWKVVKIAAPFIVVVFVVLSHSWQNEVRTLLQVEQVDGFNIVRIAVLSVCVGVLLLLAARSLKTLHSKISRKLHRKIPKRISIVLGAGITTVLVVLVVNGFLLSTLIRAANNIYSKQNSTTSKGTLQPTDPTRTGSSASLVSWETLGMRGRDFVARGPSVQQMTAFSGKEAVPSVRVYIGLDSAKTAKERARLAVAELERTNAFKREVLVVATTTGSGWIEPQTVDALEYMHNGNSAFVTQQYSYLPSWISMLVDSNNAQDAGRELFDAVYAKWSSLPEATRPKLLVYGLSLGSFGGQTAFTTLSDIERTVDGALFVGTPGNTELWNALTDKRDAGSPQVKPVLDGGKTVRWASSAADLSKPSLTTEWQTPRVVYLQHASDPVVWWSPRLLLHKPDWLQETRGSDVSSKTNWFPIVTFFQVSVDQFYGVTVPNGHGHNYANDIVAAWASVAQPSEWSEQKSTSLQKIIDTYENE